MAKASYLQQRAPIKKTLAEASPLAMIVCSCNVLSEHEVRTAASAVARRTASDVYGCLGCSPQCGRCARTIRKIIDETLHAANANQKSY